MYSAIDCLPALRPATTIIKYLPIKRLNKRYVTYLKCPVLFEFIIVKFEQTITT